MTGELPSDEDNDLSPELRCFMTVAKVMFIPVVAIAGIGTLVCVSIAVLGEFKCAQHALLPHGTGGFLIFIAWWAFGLLLVRAMGHPPTNKAFEMLTSSFELYNISLFEVSSIRVTFSMVVFYGTLIAMLPMLYTPIGIAFPTFKALWGVCVMATGPK